MQVLDDILLSDEENAKKMVAQRINNVGVDNSNFRIFGGTDQMERKNIATAKLSATFEYL
jgi:hypothetical protein